MTLSPLAREAQELWNDTVALRRRLHQFPEIGLDLPETQATVLEALDGLGLDRIDTGKATTSVIAHLQGAEPGPRVLLRADMDGLPINEDTGLPFAARNGAMHACGHDAHTAMLAGAARLLAERRGALAGEVVFVFQPGEEGWGGARTMIDEGLIEQHGPFDAAFAIHQAPVFPSGSIAWRPGCVVGSNDRFRIRVHGSGGHASMPDEAVDPIPAACEIVQSLQVMMTRRIDAVQPSILTIAGFHAGTTYNVIPEEAELQGTIRALDEHVREQVLAELHHVVEHVAAAHHCRSEVVIELSTPATVNDDEKAAWAAGVAEGLLGGDRVHAIPRAALGSEDFSHMLNEVPGAIVVLGTRPPDVATPEPLHSPRMVLDESALSTGVAMYSALALQAADA